MPDPQPSPTFTTPPTFTNRLAAEASPYLLQHAHNPVDWWPWSEEAFAEARRRDVPIFLSIGYSTCYWCHVMERESFENETIAKQMNELFVCIKVDREERPDVDELYMAATVMMTGHGGWPMTVFLEPKSLRPFYCGTYFPAETRPEYGRHSLPQVLDAMSMAWRTQREGVIEQAGQVADSVAEHAAAISAAKPLGQSQVTDAASGLLRMFDRARGGFGNAPKFPQVVFLEFLLDVRQLAADDSTGDAIDEAVKRTLTAMMIGGIFDQVGGGFHRYSVDATWTVPHFEKMLYDNAQLAAIYARAARFYGDSEFERTSRRTLDYVLREMTDSSTGMFCSAQDAEVDHREGLNYLWTPAEIRAVLGDPSGDENWTTTPNNADLAIRAYGLDKGTNFQDPHHKEEPPRNVPRLSDRADRLAAEFGLPPGAFIDKLARINERLYEARSGRKQPHLDDKAITAWNGLMIGAFALAGRVLEEPRYVAAAARCADAVMTTMWQEGRLMRTTRRGVMKACAVLEDHACLMHGLFQLHRAESEMGDGNDGQRIGQAAKVLQQVERDFMDASGTLYDTREGAPDLFIRARNSHDGAMPCGASVMLHNWLDLHEITGEAKYLQAAFKALPPMSAAIADSPIGSVNATRALLRMLAGCEDAAGALSKVGGSDSRGVEGRAAVASPRSAAEVDPVEIYAGVDRIEIGPDHPAQLTLVVKIAPGWHIAAAEAAQTGELQLSAFRVYVIGGTGIAAYADYPAPTEFAAMGGPEISVYEGTFELTVALEDTGETWTGRPLIAVAYQACNEGECLLPTTVELDIAIDRATRTP